MMIGTVAGWWNENWRYSVPIDIGVRHFDREKYPVEAAVDFQSLIGGAGHSWVAECEEVGIGRFDVSSIRVIEYDGYGEIAGEAPCIYYTDFNPRLGGEEGYVSWFLDARGGESKHYQIYFNTQNDRCKAQNVRHEDDASLLEFGVLAQKPSIANVPSENIVTNPNFECGDSDGLPKGWAVSHPCFFGLSDWPFSTGNQALKMYMSEENVDPGIRTLWLSQKIDVRGPAGFLFKCNLYLASGKLGMPCSKSFANSGMMAPRYRNGQFSRDG